jgi:hypothetical protein
LLAEQAVLPLSGQESMDSSLFYTTCLTLPLWAKAKLLLAQQASSPACTPSKPSFPLMGKATLLCLIDKEFMDSLSIKHKPV